MTTMSIGYQASSALTLTFASLTADANLLAGRQSSVLDNTSNKYDEYQISCIFTTGTSPTAGIGELWAFPILEDSGPTYPDVITNAGDAAKTITSTAIKQCGVLIGTIATDTTSNRAYPIAEAVSLKSRFGGRVPKKVVFFFVHSTVAALNSTAANHGLWATGSQPTAA